MRLAPLRNSAAPCAFPNKAPVWGNREDTLILLPPGKPTEPGDFRPVLYNISTIAVCDINQFRKLNVAHGPRIADMILAAVAERLRALSSQSKGLQLFIGRIGADQFGIIAAGAEQDGLGSFLEEAERTIAEPMTIFRVISGCRIAICIAMLPPLL